MTNMNIRIAAKQAQTYKTGSAIQPVLFAILGLKLLQMQFSMKQPTNGDNPTI